MARALVTGATGFIGSHLVRALVERGDRVTCLVRKTSDRSTLHQLGVACAEGDVMNAASIEALAGEVDVVYHLAALLKQPWHQDFLATNADGVRNVASACASAPTPPVLVVVSSIAAAGPSQGGRPRTEEDPPAPVSLYGESKLGGERAAAALCGEVPITIVRPPIVFGEGDRWALQLFRVAARGLCAVPRSDPSASLIHVEDLARALPAAADSGERVSSGGKEGTGIYFIADPEAPRMSDLGRMIAASLGRDRVRVLRVPSGFMTAAGFATESVARLFGGAALFSRDKAREATAGPWVCAVDKAREGIGFSPAAPLADRLRQTATWYRDKGWL